MTPPTLKARVLHSALPLACVLGAGLFMPSAQAQMKIVPTFDATITGSPNAAAIEAAINADCAFYAANFTDDVTVNIKFATESSGLGNSSVYYYSIGYQDYYNYLVANAATANDALALAHIAPDASGNNPVNGSAQIYITTANYRVVSGSTDAPAFDGYIYLNTSLMNLNRTSVNQSKYDLQAVAYHEINEVLGLLSSLDGSANGAAAPTGPINTMDLFRYDQNGARSFNTIAATQSYFSLNGVTHLERFNQTQGGDFHDWYSNGAHTPSVQDAYGTAGSAGILDNKTAELTALDVIGYTPKVATNAVTGRIGLEGVPNLAAVSPYAPLGTFHVSFRTAGTQTEIKAFNVTLTPVANSYYGKYTVNAPPGVYDVRISGAKNLATLLTSVVVTGTGGTVPDIVLPGGDANSDNSVDSTDFGLLIGAFGSAGSVAGSGYDAAMDFNFDGFVDSTDFGILIGEFNNTGVN